MKILTSAAAAALMAAGPFWAGDAEATSAITIDGWKGWTEWDDATELVAIDQLSLYAQSDDSNLYVFAQTEDDDFTNASNSNQFDNFDINIGLHGNDAAWRYRIVAKNSLTAAEQAAREDQGDGWFAGFDAGDDGTEVNATFGVPDSLARSDLSAEGIEWAVGKTGGRRNHEIAIPWSTILDGDNGWNYNSTLELVFGGCYLDDDALEASDTICFGEDVDNFDFGDQSTYAKFTTTSPIPVPFGAVLIATAFGAAGAVRMRAKRG